MNEARAPRAVAAACVLLFLVAVFAVKVTLVAALAAGAFFHDFVLGPGLARQIREGRPQTLRRRLVVVGWFNFALTLTVPVLGTVLAHLG